MKTGLASIAAVFVALSLPASGQAPDALRVGFLSVRTGPLATFEALAIDNYIQQSKVPPDPHRRVRQARAQHLRA